MTTKQEDLVHPVDPYHGRRHFTKAGAAVVLVRKVNNHHYAVWSGDRDDPPTTVSSKEYIKRGLVPCERSAEERLLMDLHDEMRAGGINVVGNYDYRSPQTYSGDVVAIGLVRDYFTGEVSARVSTRGLEVQRQVVEFLKGRGLRSSLIETDWEGLDFPIEEIQSLTS